MGILHIDNLTFHDKSEWSENQWVQDRYNGVGGSDMGDILGLNPYSDVTNLFYQKIGYIAGPDLSENQKVHWGNMTEAIIRDNAQYVDHEVDRSYINNKRLNKQRRVIIEPEFVITHSDYPHIRANMDGLTVDEEDWNDLVRRGQLFYPAEVDEIKTIGGRAADMWESGIPPYYVCQVHAYMLMFIDKVPDLQGWIYSLKDGFDFEWFSIPFSNQIGDLIVEKSTDFWNRVVKGREIMQEYSWTDDKKLQMLSTVEPNPDLNSKHYESFLKTDVLSKMSNKAPATNAAIRTAKSINHAQKMKKHWGGIEQRGKNVQMKRMHKLGINEFDFEEAGRQFISKGRFYNKYQPVN